MTASVYLAALGAKGLKQVAVNCASNAHYLAAKLKEINGFELVSDKEFFNEFLMTCPVDADKLNAYLAENGILGGLKQGKDILWCATEMNAKDDIDRLVSLIAAFVKEAE